MNRKCAIYSRISIGNEEQLAKITAELIEYCTQKLKITEYIVFEEIASVNDKREKFDSMINMVHKREFTDMLVASPDRLYKATYDIEKYNKIIMDIGKCGVLIHSMKDGRYISVKRILPGIEIAKYNSEDL